MEALVMQVLIIDACSSIDDTVLQALRRRGHEVTAIRAPHDALELVAHTEFDCILVDVSTAGDCLGLAEMRQLVRTSAVALMTSASVEALIAEGLTAGNIEFCALPALTANIESLAQP